MNIYLVDYENVKDLKGIDNLSQKDIVYIFYSENSDKITFETHDAINSAKCKVDKIKVKVGGKNALDFQLSLHLGYLISEYKQKNQNPNFYIISNDNGFEYVKNYCINNFKTEIVINANLRGMTKVKANENEKNNIIKILDENKNIELNKEQKEKIAEIVTQYKTKQTINTNILKLIKNSEKVGKIMKILKPILKNKN